MPLYEYRCENGHSFEALQKFSDDPISSCEICGAPAQRVLTPVAIHFKGSGFYLTDSRKADAASFPSMIFAVTNALQGLQAATLLAARQWTGS